MTKQNIPDFEPQWDLPKTPLKSAYIVCTTPRTGSNLLCFALVEQGIGTPLEYLNLLGNGSTQVFTVESLKAVSRRMSKQASRVQKSAPNTSLRLSSTERPPMDSLG